MLSVLHRAVGWLSGFGWCQVVSGCRVCVGKSRVNGAWPSGRAALLCGVRLAPRFDPDNHKQGVEESNPTCIPFENVHLRQDEHRMVLDVSQRRLGAPYSPSRIPLSGGRFPNDSEGGSGVDGQLFLEE